MPRRRNTSRPRNYRRCSRTDRSTYWAIRDLAKDLGTTDSTMGHYLWQVALSVLKGQTIQEQTERIAASLPPEDVAAFQRHVVDRDLDGSLSDDVPW